MRSTPRVLRPTLAFALLAVALSGISGAATVYLDGNLTSNCTSGNYSIAARNCSGSDGNAYQSVATISVAPSDTVLVRGCSIGGSCADSQWKYVGTFDIPSGTSASNRTTVRNYNNEQVLFCSNQRACDYGYPRNSQGGPDMQAYGCVGGSAHWCSGGSNDGGFCTSGANCPGGSCSISNAHDWYGEPAIIMDGNVTVDGVKTWGSAFISDDNSTLQNSDIGGCGAASQGQTVRVAWSGNVVVKNNFIHHSCAPIDGLPNCSSNNNGSAVMGYDWQATIENNEIFDYWYGAIRLKDAGDPGVGSGTMVIRKNYIRDTDVWGGNDPDNGPYCLSGYQQDFRLPRAHFYQNICYQSGTQHDRPAVSESVYYNNTFIDPRAGANHGWAIDAPLNWHNTLSYVHTDGDYHAFINNNNFANVTIDHNLYWNRSGATPVWHHNFGSRASTLSGWQSYTDSLGRSQDDASINATPQFVNAACINNDDCLPEDFKRNSYAENFSSHSCGSIGYGGATGACGARAGAYVTGNEKIGVDSGTNPYWNLHHAPQVAACADGIDNDGDGDVDLADSNCSGAGDSTESLCGDGVREPTFELCDGNDVGAESCATQGFSAGTLTCNASCDAFVTSACTTTVPSTVNNLRIVN